MRSGTHRGNVSSTNGLRAEWLAILFTVRIRRTLVVQSEDVRSLTIVRHVSAGVNIWQ